MSGDTPWEELRVPRVDRLPDVVQGRFPVGTKERLRRVARERESSPSVLIRYAVLEMLGEWERELDEEERR